MARKKAIQDVPLRARLAREGRLLDARQRIGPRSLCVCPGDADALLHRDPAPTPSRSWAGGQLAASEDRAGVVHGQTSDIRRGAGIGSVGHHGRVGRVGAQRRHLGPPRGSRPGVAAQREVGARRRPRPARDRHASREPRARSRDREHGPDARREGRARPRVLGSRLCDERPRRALRSAAWQPGGGVRAASRDGMAARPANPPPRPAWRIGPLPYCWMSLLGDVRDPAGGRGSSSSLVPTLARPPRRARFRPGRHRGRHREGHLRSRSSDEAWR